MGNTEIAKKINIVCLLAAMISILVLPLKKEIWYDESISILCSKGITYDTHASFTDSSTIHSTTIRQLNTLHHVFEATVADNGNSLLYNVGLHWFTMLAGNNIDACMMLSKLTSILTLVAFFVLCNMFMKNSIFPGIAVLLLVTHLNFWGMAHEIRAYSMGTLFIVVAGIYFYKFMWEEERAANLLLTGLFSVAAILSHYLSLYVVLVFLCYLVFVKKTRLLQLKNLVMLSIPVILAGIYIYSAFIGLKYMSAQNHAIAHKAASQPFTLLHVISESMALGAADFKVVFSAFGGKVIEIITGFAVVVAFYLFAIIKTTDKTEQRNLHLLFILGASGTVFLAMLCVKSHHYTALYSRYHSFCAPYACLFIAYMMYVLWKNAAVNKLITGGILAVTLLPSFLLFILYIRKNNPVATYNHTALAKEIVQERVTKIDVPEWDDALLIQSLLPDNCEVTYALSKSEDFILYRENGIERVSKIKTSVKN